MKQKFIVLFLFFQLFVASVFGQQYKYHIVAQGETVESIARQYNIGTEVIFKYNPDARNGILPQSKLVVPINGSSVEQQPVEFETHRVRRKETLFSLSQQYNVSIEDIRRYNKHLYSEELQRGERIRIPVGLQKVAEPSEEKFVKDDTGKNPLNLSKREHVVLPKETKFGISQKYNISIEELERLNPQLGILQPGMVLKIAPKGSTGETSRESEIFQYYQVKPKETLFSLTRRFQISTDSLLVLNPALEDGLKSGMVLKIPNLEAAVVSEFTEEDIVNLEERITNYEPRNVVVMLPFNLHKVVKIDTSSSEQQRIKQNNIVESGTLSNGQQRMTQERTIETDTSFYKQLRIKQDKVLQISLDFYSGVLMAIDSAKSLGLSTNVQIFDTKQSAYTVDSIINRNNFRNLDVVIGPLLQSTAEAAARNLQREGVPVISPLTSKETHHLENFFQTRPSEKMLASKMISYLSENADGKNIVIIADAGAYEKKRALLQQFPNAGIVNPKEGSFVDPKELSAQLVKHEPNWVILESDKIGILSSATSYLNALPDEDYDISLFSTDKNDSFESDNISNQHLANLNFHYPSVDREFNNSGNNSFITEYKKKYGLVPSIYAVRGFDVTYDVLLRLASAKNLLESVEEGGVTEYVENKFDYEKKETGGYINEAIYIVSYGDEMQLNVVRR